jgi:HJR/Mrr/RecB family endonuclease
MARRRKEDDVAGIVAQLVGLVLLVGFVSPQGRQLMSAFGVLTFGLLGLAFLGLIAFVIYRIATRSKRLQVASASPFTAKLAVSSPPIAATPRNPISFSPAVRGRSTIAEAPASTADLIEQLRTIDWFQFEKVVALAYRKQGYSVTRRGGANPDGGIDLVISKDGETKAVQCKQWKAWNVGVKAVREFLGALTDAGIQRGIFITLRGYTGEAKQLADKHGIEIVNETGLAAMLDATDARFDPEVLDILQDTRKFCPKCERPMVLRLARRGANAGQKFWGCSNHPHCRFTLPLAA